MQRYRVARKAEVVDAISDALSSSGAELLSVPSPTSAPFVYAVRLPSGELIDLVIYAFLANKYGQSGRPEGEHRFQIKYGSDFDVAHAIHIGTGQTVTLMMGVHLDEGLFVAVDPAMHNPTWFSSSVEFKQDELDVARSDGWNGWERSRSSSRRRAGRDAENWQTEALVAFQPTRMVDFVQFERMATGMEAGERLALASKVFATGEPVDPKHLLEEYYGLSASTILDVVANRFRLQVAVRGAVAEHHLEAYLRSLDFVDRVARLDKDGMPDFEVTVAGASKTIECKAVLRKRNAAGMPRVDFQKTRAAKGDPCSRYYSTESFDVLAACLHPVSDSWEYRFVRTVDLESHRECAGKLASNVVVAGPQWFDGLEQALVDG